MGEKKSLHPLALAIVKNCKENLDNVENMKEVTGEGVYFDYNNNDYFVGRKTLNLTDTTVELFENDIKIGEIKFEDKIKESSILACKELKKMGIKTVMLSGDNEYVVKKVAERVDVDESYSNLLPQEKFSWIEKKQGE